MTTGKWALLLFLCLFFNAAFCGSPTSKAQEIIKNVNVYFPGSELSGDNPHKLNLNVQGRIVVIPLCKTDMTKTDDHNILFTAKDKSEKILRGSDPTSSMSLQIVHGNTRIFDLLQNLQAEVCGK